MNLILKVKAQRINLTLVP